MRFDPAELSVWLDRQAATRRFGLPFATAEPGGRVLGSRSPGVSCPSLCGIRALSAFASHTVHIGLGWERFAMGKRRHFGRRQTLRQRPLSSDLLARRASPLGATQHRDEVGSKRLPRRHVSLHQPRRLGSILKFGRISFGGLLLSLFGLTNHKHRDTPREYYGWLITNRLSSCLGGKGAGEDHARAWCEVVVRRDWRRRLPVSAPDLSYRVPEG